MKNRNWLEVGENILLFGSGVGSVTSIVSQQALYAVAPLSVLFLVNLINRRRFEQISHLSTTSTIAQIDQQLTSDINTLRQQVTALPTRLEVAGLKKTVLQRQQEGLAELRKEINKRFSAFEEQSLGKVQKELHQLREQQAQFVESLNGLSSYLPRLVPTNKLEAVEDAIARLKAEFSQLQNNFQNLANEPRPNFNSFQDQINHLNRRLNNLPPPFDASAIRQDVESIIKVVGDLVPRRDMAKLTYDMEHLQQQYRSLEQTIVPLRLSIAILKKQLGGATLKPEEGEWDDAQAAAILHSDSQVKEIADKLAEFSEIVKRLEGQFAQFQSTFVLSDFQTPTVSVPGRGQQPPGFLDLFPQEDPESELIAGLESLFQATGEPSIDVEKQLQRLVNRVEQIEQRIVSPELGQNGTAKVLPQNQKSPAQAASYDLMFALPTQGGQSGEKRSVLEEVLPQAQTHLVVVFPSPDACNLSPNLLQQIQEFLERKGQLEVGLGYLENMEQTRFGRWLDPQWMAAPLQSSQLQTTLSQLIQLKQQYPQQFGFKVLGTDENFVICDRRFAVLGVQSLAIASAAFPKLEMGLKTSDPRIIEGLVHRFNHPALDSQSATAYFNRAVTRYELGDRQGAIADYTEALRLDLHDEVAYNNRGIARYEIGDRTGALADFQEALRINPDSAVAYFNRGYGRAEMDDRVGAINDYTQSIQLAPQSAVAYFNRGLAKTRSNDKQGAIEDYSQVLHLQPGAAIAYFYRGLAYTKLNATLEAMQDLEQAARLFHHQGNHVYLDKAKTMLEKLRAFLTPLGAKAGMPGRSAQAPIKSKSYNSYSSFGSSDTATISTPVLGTLKAEEPELFSQETTLEQMGQWL